jgi:hypothetical protein
MNNSFQPVYRAHGRAIYVERDGTLYRSHHYDIFRSTDTGQSWELIASIPRPSSRRLIEPVRLLCRLLRHEVRAFLPLNNGRYVAATRSGVFYSRPDDRVMIKSKIESGAHPPQYPITMSYDIFGKIIWGEYWYNAERRGVRIYGSDDDGYSYHVVHSFKPGETRHVHNLLYDESLNKYWVFTGDHKTEPGIGLLDADFSHFEWVHKGKQIYRVVWGFDLGDRLLYATDTEKEMNGIFLLDKNTARTEHITEINGSCIYATRSGKYYIISTTAEPVSGSLNAKNPVNSSIWISSDGIDWRNILTATKDLSSSDWSYRYFQFGSIVLPAGECEQEILMFSGQALRKMDGKVYTMQLSV